MENFTKNWNIVKSAKLAIVVIILALIRCILEVFRLHYLLEHVEKDKLIFNVIQPFLIGALSCSISILVMTLFYFNSKFKFVIAFSIFTVLFLLYIKFFLVFNF